MTALTIVTVNATTRHFADVAVRRAARALTSEELHDAWLPRLVADLFETLYSTPGGIGLAATQVGVLLRVAVIALHDDSAPLVLVNPSYEPFGRDREAADERCLSVPDVVGAVERFRRITVRFHDHRGEAQERQVEGFLARVMQHEIDHLDGVLCIDRVHDPNELRPESGGFPARRAQRAVDDLFSQPAGTESQPAGT